MTEQRLTDIDAALIRFASAHERRAIAGLTKSYDGAEECRAAYAELRAILSADRGEPVATFSAPTVLPDGSAFATASWPLPKDHWLYAPSPDGWDNERDCMPDLPRPILTHAVAKQVQAALRYAIRAATMNGKEPDLDPDALVQNATVALCGFFGTAAAPSTPQPAPEQVPVETLLEWAVLDGVVRLSKVMDADLQDALRKFASRFGATPQPAPEWADIIEQRLLTWRQRLMNKSGDHLALDDFMSQESIDDLVDFVCAPLATPQPDTVQVPREPTQDMLYAMAELDGWKRGDREHPMLTRWEDYWNAAIAAAPKESKE